MNEGELGVRVDYGEVEVLKILFWLLNSGLSKDNYGLFTHTFFCLPKKSM